MRIRPTFTLLPREAPPLEVEALRGREDMGRPYLFELVLPPGPDRATFLGRPATLERGPDLRIHGLVTACADLAEGRMKLWLRPRLWRLSLSIRSHTALHRSAPRVLEDLLPRAGLTSLDWDLGMLGAGHAAREHLCQCGESDLDFLHRWCREEGISYFFDQEAGRDRVVFVDAASPLRAGPPLEAMDLRSRHRPEGPPAFQGWTSSPGLAAGQRFILEGERDCLVTEILRRDGGPLGGCRFRAIQGPPPLPPPSPAPRLGGLRLARTLGPGSEDRVQVAMPFDPPEGPWGRHPRLLAFGGGGGGFRPPLPPGTEVFLGHLEGHPDLPFVQGVRSRPFLGEEAGPLIRAREGQEIRFLSPGGDPVLRLASPEEATSLELDGRPSPEGGVRIRTDGVLLRRVAGTDIRLTEGLQVEAALGGHQSVTGLQEAACFLGPRFEACLGSPVAVGLATRRFTLDMDTRWAGAIRETGGHHHLGAEGGIPLDLEVLTRASLALGSLLALAARWDALSWAGALIPVVTVVKDSLLDVMKEREAKAAPRPTASLDLDRDAARLEAADAFCTLEDAAALGVRGSRMVLPAREGPFRLEGPRGPCLEGLATGLRVSAGAFPVLSLEESSAPAVRGPALRGPAVRILGPEDPLFLLGAQGLEIRQVPGHEGGCSLRTLPSSLALEEAGDDHGLTALGLSSSKVTLECRSGTRAIREGILEFRGRGTAPLRVQLGI